MAKGPSGGKRAVTVSRILSDSPNADNAFFFHTKSTFSPQQFFRPLVTMKMAESEKIVLLYCILNF
jgi:hypothetical protein